MEIGKLLGEFCVKHGALCIKNDEFCIKKDEHFAGRRGPELSFVHDPNKGRAGEGTTYNDKRHLVF